MPNLDRETGLAVCGTAGGRVSYGGRTGEALELVDGGATFWLRPGVIVYIGPESGSWAAGGRTLAQVLDVATGRRAALDDREPAFLAAAAGRWQAGLAGKGGSFGSCGEHPGGTISRAMTDFRGAAGVDGTIALVDSYHAVGAGFRLGRPDGSIFPPLEEPAIGHGGDQYHLTVIDQNRAIWPSAGAWGTVGISPAPLWLPGSLRAAWVELPAGPYLVHWLEGVGLVARRADSSRGKVLARVDREYHYDAIAWNGGIRIAWATIDGEPPGSLVIEEWDGVSDLEELAPIVPPAVIPSFRFSHPVIAAVFKDPEGSSGATHEITVNAAGMTIARPHFAAEDSLEGRRGELLGIYSERSDAPGQVLELAAAHKTRLLLCRDAPGLWTIPAGLRPYDIPARELYLVKGETVAESARRWRFEIRRALEDWPGDVAVVPMFYCAGGAPPNEVWPVSLVCQGLAYLDGIVNESPRIKLIAAFSYQRANGIVAHPELRAALENLKTAAAAAGLATLTPITTPPIEPPIDPPAQPRKLSKGLTMEIDGKTVRLRGAGLRTIAPDAPGTGIWGASGDPDLKDWRGVLYVGDDAPANLYRAKAIPGDRYVFTNIDHNCVAGADGGQYSTGLDRQGYHKPTGNTDAGDLEQWRVYEGNEIGSMQAQIEQVSDDKHPAGAGKKIVVFVLTVEIVQ